MSLVAKNKKNYTRFATRKSSNQPVHILFFKETGLHVQGFLVLWYDVTLVYTHYHNSNLIWRAVSRRVDEVIPSDHPRRVALRVIQWYGLIHETWYCTPDQVTIMIICLLYAFFAHLSLRLMGELIVYQSLRRPSVVRPQFQTSYPLKPLSQLNSNFIWRLLRTREWKFVQMVLVTWPRWLPRPYKIKTL